MSVFQTLVTDRRRQAPPGRAQFTKFLGVFDHEVFPMRTADNELFRDPNCGFSFHHASFATPASEDHKVFLRIEGQSSDES